MTLNKPTLGENLRRLRESAGLTQMELAVAAGVTVSNVSQIEQGKIPNPRLDTLLKLASALKLKSLDDLVGIPDDTAEGQS